MKSLITTLHVSLERSQQDQSNNTMKDHQQLSEWATRPAQRQVSLTTFR
jgi:hypothetical protein